MTIIKITRSRSLSSGFLGMLALGLIGARYRPVADTLKGATTSSTIAGI